MSGRPAVANFTPIPSVLDHEERLSNLERENAILQETVRNQAFVIGALQGSVVDAHIELRQRREIDTALQRQIERITRTQQGDLRLSEVLGELDERLGAVEQGVCR